MAVKGKPLKYTDAPAVDQRWKEQVGAAERIQNFRIDPEGDGWLADRGLEPWKDFSGESLLAADTTPYFDKKVDSCFVWTKQSTGQVYYFAEQGGELYYQWGNNNAATLSNFWRDKITIATDRKIRGVGDPGTQYIPYGNRLLIINGFDKPIWFYGDGRFRDFGFTIATPEAELIGVQDEYDKSTNRLKSGLGMPRFGPASTRIGLGDAENGDVNAFNYKMTFITDTGSESPIGNATSVGWECKTGYEFTRSVFINELPTGKEGVVARRLYRTKNRRTPSKSTANDSIYYLVREIEDNTATEYIDVAPDTALVTQAPDLNASVPISTTFQFGASWNNRIWLGGGPDNATRIIYSEAGFPEQFGALNYFDVGVGQGGHITKLFPFYNALLVFRERSIDVVRQGPTGLTISALSPDVGTMASNTICLVPGIGVCFLNRDGIYAVTGGLDGGSIFQVKKISQFVAKDLQAINVPALANATAAYSKKEKEYWIHFVRKGETVPTRGLVLHTYNGGFSQRGSTDKLKEYQWAFTALTVDPQGNFIIGTRPDWRLANGSASNPTTDNAIGTLVGLQVWSGANYFGKTLTAGSAGGQGERTYTGDEITITENIWESNWINFGDGSIKHRVFNVEMEMVSYGDNAIKLDWGYDYETTWNSAGTQKASKPEIVFTTKEDPVFGADKPSETKVPFKIGTSALKAGRIVTIRWDVNTGLVDNFRFRLRANTPYHVLGFTINYTSVDQLPLNQRTRLQKGQPY